MKKLIPVFFLLLGVYNANSQCTPDGSATAPGIHPTTAEGLAVGTVGTPYSQTLTVIIPADTTILLFGVPTTIPITKAVVTSVTGLPAGFSYACNPATCEFPGGETHCAVITGTPVAGQEGSYPLKIYVTYYAGTLTQNDTVTGYTLQINPLGINEVYRNGGITAFAAPNPFVNSTDITYNMPYNADVRISVYNLLGKVIKTEVVKSFTGENTWSLKGNTMLPGVYLVELNDGHSKITRRVVKQ